MGMGFLLSSSNSNQSLLFVPTKQLPVFNKQTLHFNSIRSNTFNSLRAVPQKPHTIENDGIGKEDAKKQVSGLKSLLRAYKEAIIDGDENTLLEIEAHLHLIENDKDNLVHQLSAFPAEIKSWKEKYIRLQSDFDNFRKRSEKETLNTRTNAQGEVIESLLLMVDSFEQAKQQIKPETEREKKIDASYQGIYKQFVEIMRSLNVSSVSTVGKPFDPLVHEAIARENSQEFKDGIVTKELRRGFCLGDRLLRPAMVKVSAGPGPQKAHVDTEKTAGQSPTAAF